VRRLGIALALAVGAVAAGAQQKIDILDPLRTPIMQNSTIAVTHLRFNPGTREQTHTHPFPLLLVQITPGEIDVNDLGTIKHGTHLGEVFWIPTNRQHAVQTRPGAKANVDLLAIALLPDRTHPASLPTIDAQPGITRTTLMDNNDMRVVRVRFEPNSKEVLHTHPYDLVTIQLTAGRIEIASGNEHTVSLRDVGFVNFVDRNVQHAYASADPKPFEILSVAVK
jgi:quercetin dioxygenase-like cupin family protein